MTELEAVNEGYTHRVSYYGIPCWWRDDDSTMLGVNDFWDRLILLADIFHDWIAGPLLMLPGFPIKFQYEIGVDDEQA